MSAQFGQSRGRRIGAGSAAIAVHVALALALASIAVQPADQPAEAALDLFDVPPALPRVPPPPVAEPKPARKLLPRPQGAAAPMGKRAIPTAIVAPPPIFPLPLPIVVAPVASSGAAPGAGAAAIGTATGAGGSGAGLGSGPGGSGTGGGGGEGISTRAKLLRGAIGNRDYPPAARKAGAMGTVTVRFTVDASGRPGGCAVTASSGTPALDAATCRLIEARFRYAPARGRDGAAIAELRGWRQRWWFAE